MPSSDNAPLRASSRKEQTIVWIRTLVGVIMLSGPMIGSAGAQTQAVNKTWVASSGTDTGTCPNTEPCRTLAYALDQTVAGGEIFIKDAAAYGGVTTYKSINIIADGVIASVGPQSYEVIGIDIEGPSTNVVTVHGVTIDTHSSNGSGVRTNCGCHVVLDHVVIHGNNIAVEVLDNDFVMISNSLLSGNYIGVSVSQGTVYASHNTITINSYGLYGNVYSYNNNAINGNTICDTCKANVIAAPPE